MRRFSRHGLSVFGAMALMLLLAGQATASIYWCKADPTVEIDGNRVDINVYSTEAVLDAVTAPTEVRIFVPRGVRTELIAADEGFGLGWDVTFEQDKDLRRTPMGVETRVLVKVPVDDGTELPVKAEIVDDGVVIEETVGETNRYVRLKAWL